jgi:hypothetical protein
MTPCNTVYLSDCLFDRLCCNGAPPRCPAPLQNFLLKKTGYASLLNQSKQEILQGLIVSINDPQFFKLEICVLVNFVNSWLNRGAYRGGQGTAANPYLEAAPCPYLRSSG